MKWRSMQKQGKGCEIGFSPALRRCLKGRIANALLSAQSLGVLFERGISTA